MNKNKICFTLLMLPAICFLALIAYLEIANATSPQVKIAAVGYDPRSLISGHYLNLRLDWNNTDCQQFPQKGCPPQTDYRSIYQFFIPEKDARKLEKLIRQPNNKTELLFSLPPFGEPQVINLIINDIPWQDAL